MYSNLDAAALWSYACTQSRCTCAAENAGRSVTLDYAKRDEPDGGRRPPKTPHFDVRTLDRRLKRSPLAFGRRNPVAGQKRSVSHAIIRSRFVSRCSCACPSLSKRSSYNSERNGASGTFPTETPRHFLCLRRISQTSYRPTNTDRAVHDKLEESVLRLRLRLASRRLVLRVVASTTRVGRDVVSAAPRAPAATRDARVRFRRRESRRSRLVVAERRPVRCAKLRQCSSSVA